jgi:ferritin-like metal-binding protein YciE
MGKSSNNTYGAMEKNQANSENGNTEKNNTLKSDKNKSGKTLDVVLKKNLKEIYSAEKQLIEALPEMVKAADNEDLQDAFTDHLQETRRHAERIEKIFERMDIDKKDEKTSKVMQAMIEEVNKIIAEYEKGPVRDSALIIVAQKVEHHEIAAYEALFELAEALRYPKIAEILERTLVEEEDTDKHLGCLVQDINDEACGLQHTEEEEMA